MPTTHAAFKELRKSEKRQERNNAIKSELRTLTNRLTGLLKDRKLDESKVLIRTLAKKYDRAATKGLVHKRTAARVKSRLTRQINHAR